MTRRRSRTEKEIVSGRTGRRPGPSTTRAEILAAARECFAKRGYDATSLRAIAAEARVDPALVRRFFGSKEGVLIAALTATFRPDQDIAEVVSGDLDTLGDQIIRYTLSLWEQAPTQELLVGMLRSACTNEPAARLLRDFITNQILGRLAGAVRGRGGGRWCGA